MLFIYFIVAMLDMNISQFLKSLGLEHLRDIFEREQVSHLKNTAHYRAVTIFTVLLHVWQTSWCNLLNLLYCFVFLDHPGCAG